MSALPAYPPAQGSEGSAGSGLLMDLFLPEYDLSIVHADVFRAPPAECYEAALEMDLFQTPLARVLLGLRALPQRVEGAVKGRGRSRGAAVSHTFRLKDMVTLGWILLGETPGAQIVLGQVSRPWKSVAASIDAPTAPEQFARFSKPGYAKIAAGLRIDPYGTGSSILTVETPSSSDARSRKSSTLSRTSATSPPTTRRCAASRRPPRDQSVPGPCGTSL